MILNLVLNRQQLVQSRKGQAALAKHIRAARLGGEEGQEASSAHI